ncbi:MAG: hypothetical protein AB1704_06380, partial [Pseudomonadota bacterium]
DLTGSSDTADISGSGNVGIADGSGDLVNVYGNDSNGDALSANDQIDVTGNNSTGWSSSTATNANIDLTGSIDTADISGSDNTGIASASGDLVNVYGNDSHGDALSSSDTIDVTGSNSTGWTSSTATNSNIDLTGGDDTAYVSGSDNSGVADAGHDTVDVYGNDSHGDALSSDDQINVTGSDSTAWASNTAYDTDIDLSGSSDTANAGDNTSVVASGSDDFLNGDDLSDGTNYDINSNGATSDGGGDYDDDGDTDPPPDDGTDDPVILNLSGGQVQTTSVTGSTTYFDMQNDGQSVQTAWMTPGEGMLVYDPANPNSATDDADLVSGFAALDALDSNGDGVLNASDSAWSQLRVLVDIGNGQPDQLFTLGQLGISSINLNATAEEVSQNGNVILANSTFTRTDGSTGDVAGVALQFNPGSIQSTAAGGNASVTSQAFVDHRLNQLIAGMASFNPQPAGSTNLMHDEHGQHHMVLAASSH